MIPILVTIAICSFGIAIYITATWIQSLQYRLKRAHLRLDRHISMICDNWYETDQQIKKLTEELEQTKKELVELQICLTNHLGMGQQAPQPDEPTTQRLQDKA